MFWMGSHLEFLIGIEYNHILCTCCKKPPHDHSLHIKFQTIEKLLNNTALKLTKLNCIVRSGGYVE
jgi:hypothetical protein